MTGKKLFSVEKKPKSPSTPLVEKPKPVSVECPEHGIQQVIGLSVCPICGEPSMEK